MKKEITKKENPEVEIRNEAESLSQQAALLIADVAALPKIVTAEDAQKGSELRNKIKAHYKTIEERRKFFVAGPTKWIDNINAMFRVLKNPLTEAEKQNDNRLMEYQRKIYLEQEKIRQENEKKLAELEAKKAEAITEKQVEKIEQKQINIQAQMPVEAPAKINGGAGSTNFIDYWTFKKDSEGNPICDLTKVPIEYLILDVKKVQKVIDAGIREIPGVTIIKDIKLRAGK